jgi:threonine/homoserine/homoserine lactone efflux protein
VPAHLLAFVVACVVVIAVPGPSVVFAIGRALVAGRRRALCSVAGNAVGIGVQVMAVGVGLGAVLAGSAAAFTVVKLAGAAYLAYLGIRMLISALMSVDPAADAEADAALATTAVPETALPGPAVPGTAVPGPAVPGTAVPKSAVPGPAMPGTGVPGATAPGTPVPGAAVPIVKPTFPAAPVGTPAPAVTVGPVGPGTAEGRAGATRAGEEPVRSGTLTGGAAFRQGLITNLLNPKIALLFLTLLPQFVAHDEPRLRTTATLAVIFLAVAVVWWRTFSFAIGPLSRVLRGGTARRVLDGLAGTALLAISAVVALDGDR